MSSRLNSFTCCGTPFSKTWKRALRERGIMRRIYRSTRSPAGVLMHRSGRRHFSRRYALGLHGHVVDKAAA